MILSLILHLFYWLLYAQWWAFRAKTSFLAGMLFSIALHVRAVILPPQLPPPPPLSQEHACPAAYDMQRASGEGVGGAGGGVGATDGGGGYAGGGCGQQETWVFGLF